MFVCMRNGARGGKEIDLEEDMRFQKKEWRVQHIGWAVWVVILLAAAIGLTGRGLFSKGYVSEPESGLHLEYDRVTRHESSSELILRIGAAPGDSTVRLQLGREFVEKMQIDR